MFKTIKWRMHINAKSKEKAQKVINRVKQEIGEIEVYLYNHIGKV
ncbi:hypothetical protein ACQKM9_16295 [Viridibacillus sp. NPDC093762]